MMKQKAGVCLLILVLMFAFTGCTNTQRGVATGSALGAVSGLGIAAISGGYLGWGTLAGAGIGALAGGITGYQKDSYEKERQANRRKYEKEDTYED